MCARNARTRFLFFRRPLPNRLPRRRCTAAVCRSRFRLRHFPTGRPTRPQRPPYPPLLRRQRTASQHTTAAAYCRSTPTKAAIPISTPTKTAMNPWPKSSATTKTKGNTSPISTPTKSAYCAR